MNLRRLTPSISLLLAFEAAARHQSFARAADELSLTQSAVSRQVAALEDMLEIQLFHRNGKRVSLTDAGTLYASSISNVLESLRKASLQVISFKSESRTLRLALLPTFGSRWLLPRLHRFYKEHPGIVVHIHTRVGEINDFAGAGVDASIGVRDRHSAGAEILELCREVLVPIVSPKLLLDKPLTHPNDLADHLLLHVSSRPEQWPAWLHGQNLQLRNCRAGPHFEVTDHLIQAACAGVGVGLVPRVLVEDEIARGELVIPFPYRIDDERVFCLAYPVYNAHLPHLRAFRAWLETEKLDLSNLDD